MRAISHRIAVSWSIDTEDGRDVADGRGLDLGLPASCGHGGAFGLEGGHTECRPPHVLRLDALTRRRWRAGPPIALERIKLYEPEAFAGMRKAGRLVAEFLNMLVPEIRPGVRVDAMASKGRNVKTN